MRRKFPRIGLLAVLVAIAMMTVTTTSAQAREAIGHRAAASGVAAHNSQGKLKAPVRFKSAQGTFKGAFVPRQFSVVDNQVVAQGDLVGKVHKKGHKPQWVSQSTSMPLVTSAAGSTTPNAMAPNAAPAAVPNAAPAAVPNAAPAAVPNAAPAAVLSCDVLNLVLGPLDLNLLGLNVHLDKVVLDITAVPTAGLLGQLLCAVANLLGGVLTGLLGQLAALLNQILGQLGL